MNRVPKSTYRLQLSEDCGFAAVRGLLDYLQRLGISDLYLSPLFRSRAASSHGYDVVSHSEVEPTFGTLQDFISLSDEARARGMGILLDVVPNHMGINDLDNSWWNDVLFNGPLSRYAAYFDIDWERPDEQLRNKLLLPVLGDYFGEVLERGELKLSHDAGRFTIVYGKLRFPANSSSWIDVLTIALSQLNECAHDSRRNELESIITQLRNLPGGTTGGSVSAAEREREQNIAAARLAAVAEESGEMAAAIESAVAEVNNEQGATNNFDKLEQMLSQQWYRLAYWKVAADEINYRRFFDINDLAAIRVELPEVFDHTHDLVFELLAADRITGLRIDHPDGLYDPQEYLECLQKRFRELSSNPCQNGEQKQLYVVVEKILTGREQLAAQWPVAGTTGYDFLNSLSQVLVDGEGLSLLQAAYDELLGERSHAADVTYESKRQILHDALASELAMLALRLHRIAQANRKFRDFTFPSLLRGLREVIACFPVYRTYIRSQGWEVDSDDHGRISQSIRMAKRRNPATPRAVYDLISTVLRLNFPASLSKQDRENWREFSLRFQQVTGPVTAKGIEDTAFYRYIPLASLNEVGGDLNLPSLTVNEFHGLMQRRQLECPHALSATATHDTKRGEDLRARLHVLSEVPEKWRQFALYWNQAVSPLLREVEGRAVPDPLERYLLLQTLVGTWPVEKCTTEEWLDYRSRISAYMTKALREAKRNTSWVDPAAEYEDAVTNFVGDLLDPANSQTTMSAIDAFVRGIADAAYLNSLSQLILKATLPGIPDFYQGTELWDFNLVDPDNRRRVDFEARHALLRDLQAKFETNPVACCREVIETWPATGVKLFLTWRLLTLRAAIHPVFGSGTYLPLVLSGGMADHAIAFLRTFAETELLVIVPRHMRHSMQSRSIDSIDWQETVAAMPDQRERTLTNYLTLETVRCQAGTLELASLLRPFPFGIYVRNAVSEHTT